MASSDREGGPEPATLLLEALTDPDRVTGRLPYVVGLFESGERFDRLCAAWICCLVVIELDDEGAVEYLVRRLSDRLDDGYVSLELTTALDYISTRHSERVEDILEEIADDAESRDVPLPRVGNFTRSHYYSTGPEREGTGRTRVPGSERGDDPRRAYADTEREERERDEHERDRDRERDTGGSDEGRGDGGKGGGSENEGGLGGPMADRRAEVSSIAARSRFDKLHILASRRRDRYADVYEALVARGGEERAVALRLLHRPDGDRLSFEEAMEAKLRRWQATDGHPNLVSVFDWGTEPRPWLVTMFTGDSLAEADRVPPERAVQEVTGLAGAVAHLHRNGVVHGGIDPRNVSYPGDILEADGRAPALDNVGLMGAFRFHFDPSLCLDPRYAAPEYFDDSYGRVDHSTDIYHLGAVLYRRLTGRPPFSGQFVDVREGALSRDPAPPSQVAEGVPPALDEVVRKAMAKGKLTRYETVEHFERELAGVGADDG